MFIVIIFFIVTLYFSILNLVTTLDYTNSLYSSNVSMDLTIDNARTRFFPITLITIAWFFMFYIFLFYQSYIHTIAFIDLIKSNKVNMENKERINKTKLKRGGYDLASVDTVNTMVRNTIEQSMSFLLLLWLNAIYRPIFQTMIVGMIWLMSRCLYPFLCKDVGSSPLIFLSTIPGYLAQWYFAYAILISTIF